MVLNKRQRTQVGNYLAMIHATGCRVSGLHTGTGWSTEVLLGEGYNLAKQRFEVKSESLHFIENHPLLATIEALKAQGFRVNTVAINRYRRWTISRGVPMCHTEDFRTLVVDIDGSARQLDGPDGRWAYTQLGNPGRNTRQA